MIKKLLVAFVFLVSAVLNAQTVEETTLLGFGYKGNVESVVVQKFVAQTRRGKVVRGARDGAKEIFTFNKNGLLSKIEKYIDNDSVAYETSLYTYNEKGKVIKVSLIEQKKSFNSKFTYDAKGNLLERATSDMNGKIVEKATYTYDKNGKMIKKRYYDSIGENEGVEENSYDEVGRKIQMVQYWNGKFDWKEEYIYKNKKSDILVIKKSYDIDGKLQSKINYKHNKEGKVISEINTYIASNRKNTTTYAYNKQGDVSKFQYKTPSAKKRKPTKYKYDYDNKGNWSQMIEYLGGDAKYITVRDIVYYQ